MSYATPSDMIARYDVRRLGDLVQDTNTRVSPSALLTDANLQTALDDAAGMIDAAGLKGQRYLPADLAALTGQDKNFLLRLNCDLAYGYLVSRRGYSLEDTLAQAPMYATALKVLERLENGDLVFNVPTAIAAFLPVPGVVISQNTPLISSTTRIFGDLTVDVNTDSPFE